METTNTISRSTFNRLGLCSACLLGFVCFGASAYTLLYSFMDGGIPFFRESYVLPGVLLVLFVLAIPSLVLFATRKFDFFHPLVYPVWSYFFPVFVIGSLYFATGMYEPHFIDLITDRDRSIPLALMYVAIGFASLSLGFIVPPAKRWGEALAKRLPEWKLDMDRLIPAALVLLLVGRVFELKAFAAGAVGYQITDDTAALGNAYHSLSLLSSLTSLLLWMAVFRASRFQVRHYLTVCILVILVPYSMFIGGGKGGLLWNMIAILFAYQYSGRRLRIRHGVLAGILLLLALLAGMVYGTLFRLAKGDESRIGVVENIEIGISTVNVIRESNFTENLGFAVQKAFERFETLTSFSLVVARYEYLRPFEKDYGIANNIWTDLWTAVIPRFVWANKPLIGNARALADLYFEYPDNSYAITPMGDLLRNFGPVGVPLGMAFLGIVLRILHTGLVNGHPPDSWRSACYYLLLVTISYESFYGSIFPSLLRVGIILFLGMSMLYMLMNIRNIIFER